MSSYENWNSLEILVRNSSLECTDQINIFRQKINTYRYSCYHQLMDWSFEKDSWKWHEKANCQRKIEKLKPQSNVVSNDCIQKVIKSSPCLSTTSSHFNLLSIATEDVFPIYVIAVFLIFSIIGFCTCIAGLCKIFTLSRANGKKNDRTFVPQSLLVC